MRPVLTLYIAIVMLCSGVTSAQQTAANNGGAANDAVSDHTGSQLVPRTAEEVKTKICQPWSKDEGADTFCGFLRDNYSTLQKVCGLAPTKSWLEPWTWFRDTDPINAVPPQILSSMHSRMLLKTDNDPQSKNVVLEDVSSLSRLLTYVTDKDPVSGDSSTLVADIMSKIISPQSIGANLQFNPVLDPEIMLVAGNGSVVHSLSCSDVWSAMVNAGASYNVAKAAAKISAEDDTDTTYKLVYGLFASPMEYAREERPDTYYFEALDWYIREARSGHAPPATGPYYVKGVRGIAIYSTLKGQSTTTGSANASAGFSAPVFSIDASASDNAESNGQIKTRIFHVLLGQASSANLPSFADTVKYLSAINANPKSQVSFDKQRQNLKMSVEIDGMPHSLCRRDIWQASPRTKGSTDSPHPSLALVDAVYHKPGESVVQGSVRTASQCEFELSAEVDPGDTADFTGILSPNMGGIVTSNEPSKDPSLAIWFDVPYSLPNPKLSALDTPSADSKNEGDWEFQIEQGNGIDKSVDPDTSAVTLICSPALTQLAVTNATFESVFKNAKGSYLKVHASLSPATADVKTCTLGGFVKLTGVNGVAANACIGKSPCPSKSSNVKVGTNAAGSN